MLDFLAPRIDLYTSSAVRYRQSKPSRTTESVPQRRFQSTATATASKRSSSAPIDSTPPPICPAKVLSNPRSDDEGNEMTISITPRASSRLTAIALSDASPNLALRVAVSSGGCHGFQYLMSLESLSPPSSPSTTSADDDDDDGDSADEDTIFAAPDHAEARVVMNGPSLKLLRGSMVDYTEELIGSQFKIVGNPRARSSCGCGTSFDVEF